VMAPDPDVDGSVESGPMATDESLSEDTALESVRAETLKNLPKPGVDFPENFDRSEEPPGSSQWFRWGTYGLGVVILVVTVYVVIAQNLWVAKELNPGIDGVVDALREGGLNVGAVTDLGSHGGASSAKQV